MAVTITEDNASSSTDATIGTRNAHPVASHRTPLFAHDGGAPECSSTTWMRAIALPSVRPDTVVSTIVYAAFAAAVVQ